MSFAETLEQGLAGESLIAGWLRRRGCTVIPAYEKLLDTGKGPQVYGPRDSLIAPDMLCFCGERVWWIEAKSKTAFSWHRIGNCWVTGIDLRHYADYCQVQEETPWPVWLLFLQEGGRAKDTPLDKPDSPAGLFGNPLAFLREHEHHRHPNGGRAGMVYWSLDALRLVATLAEVRKSAW